MNPLVRIAKDHFVSRHDATVSLIRSEDGSWLVVRTYDSQSTATQETHETKTLAAKSLAESLIDRSVAG